MKTIVNKIHSAAVNNVTLIHDVKANKLMDVKYEGTIVDLDGSCKHHFSNNGKVYVIPQESKNFRMYASRAHFEDEQQVGTIEFFVDASNTNRRFKFIKQESRDVVGVSSISFVDGVPTEVDAPLVGFKVVNDYV